MGSFFVLGITLQVLSLALADDPCAAYATNGKTCTMTDTGNGGYDCACIAPVTVTNVASHTSQLPKEFNIVGLGSGRCADVAGVGLNDNQQLIIWDCLGKGQRNQVWKAEPAPGGGYFLVVQHTAKCLTIKGSNANGALIVQYECVDAPNQVWQFQNPNGKMSKITNPASGGKCMDVGGKGTANGVGIILWDCHGQENQIWNVKAL